MKKWSDSMGEIKFEGRERVIDEIMRLENEKLSFGDKLKRLMDKEVEIPIAAAVSACMIVMILGTSGILTDKEAEYAYSITVVDEWGQYETY